MKKWLYGAIALCVVAGMVFFAKATFFSQDMEKELRAAIATIPVPYSLTVGKVETRDGGKKLYLLDVVLTLQTEDITVTRKADRVELEGLNLAAFDAPEKGAFLAKATLYGVSMEMPGYSERIETLKMEGVTGDFASLYKSWTVLAPVASRALQRIATMPYGEFTAKIDSPAFLYETLGQQGLAQLGAFITAQNSLQFTKYALRNYSGRMQAFSVPVTLSAGAYDVLGWQGLHIGSFTCKKAELGFGSLMRITAAELSGEKLVNPDYGKVFAALNTGKYGLASGLDAMTRKGAVGHAAFNGVAVYLGTASSLAPVGTIATGFMKSSASGMAEESIQMGITDLVVKRSKIPPIVALMGVPVSNLPEELSLSGKLDIASTELPGAKSDLNYRLVEMHLKDLADLLVSGNMLSHENPRQEGDDAIRLLDITYTDRGLFERLMKPSSAEKGTVLDWRQPLLLELQRIVMGMQKRGLTSVAQVLEHVASLVKGGGTVNVRFQPKTEITFKDASRIFDTMKDADLGITSSFVPIQR